MKLKIFMATALFALSPLVADQFAYIEPATAKKAAALLQKESDLLSFCEPCGDLKGTVVRITRVEEVDVNYEGRHEVKINGDGIDLAYTFVRRGGKWKNLAVELGLTPNGTSAEVPLSNPPRKPTPDR